MDPAAELFFQMLIMTAFGAGAAADAFNIAFTIPNVFRRLLAEGASAVAFVPVFGEVLVQQGREQLQRLFRVTLGLFTVLLLVFCALGMAASPWLVKLFAPGFEPLRHELAVTLTRVLFPYLLLVGLTSLFAGALNTLRHFAAPAAAPILLNIGIVTSALLLSGVVKPPCR